MNNTAIVSAIEAEIAKQIAERDQFRMILTSYEDDKAAKIQAAKDRYAAELSNIEEDFMTTVGQIKSNISDLSASISNQERALAILDPTKKAVKTDKSKKGNTEAIQDTIISLLFRHKEPVSVDTISLEIDRKGLFDPDKNRNSVLTSILSNMVSNGTINRINNGYQLADKEEAELREIDALKVRRMIKEFVDSNDNGVTAIQIRDHLSQNGIRLDDTQRLHGMLLGMRAYIGTRSAGAHEMSKYFPIK